MTTIPETLAFFEGQAKYMAENGFEVSFVSSEGAFLNECSKRERADAHMIRMRRAIDPLQDTIAICRLFALFRRLRPVIVHAHTPKAGLLGMIAARLAGVPVRIYHVHGLPELTARGFTKFALHWSERVAGWLSSGQLAVSESVMASAITLAPERAGRLHVLLNGTINGVDCLRFHPGLVHSLREPARKRYGIPLHVPVIGFVGRLTADKGLSELTAAWRVISAEFKDAHLIVVGSNDSRNGLAPEVLQYLNTGPRIHQLAPMANSDMPAAYAAIDVVALPSYREGFPYVPLEASAMGLPVVATHVCGCVDAVIHNVTGLLVAPRSADGLAAALRTYLLNPSVARQHGLAGRERVVTQFAQRPLWEAMRSEYVRFMSPNKAVRGPDQA